MVGGAEELLLEVADEELIDVSVDGVEEESELVVEINELLEVAILDV